MAEKEYIEKETVLKHLDEVMNNEFCDADFKKAALGFSIYVSRLAAADVEPIRHGRWKKGKGNERPTENGFVHDDRYICNCCGWGCCCETKLNFSFCPNCGAKMDGGEGE